MNTNITITRDKVLIPSAKVEIVIPEDAADGDIADFAVELNRAQRNAFHAVIDCPACEQYEAENEAENDDEIELEGESLRPALPNDVRKVLLNQLDHLDKLATGIMADYASVACPDHTVNNLATITNAMCQLAEALRV
jgi:hypothetical protein